MLIINDPDNKTLKSIARELRAGAVIVYPTDTAYAIGCDATSTRAVAKIFKIKGRHASKALPLIVADTKMAKKFFKLTTSSSQLATRHWPGPLSIILAAKKGIVKAVLKNGTAALRVPKSKIARTLSKFLGRPLVATSANLSGQPACYSARTYPRQINVIASKAKQSHGDRRARLGSLAMTDKPDLILDAGALPHRKPSTIVSVSKSGTIEVLRKGPVIL